MVGPAFAPNAARIVSHARHAQTRMHKYPVTLVNASARRSTVAAAVSAPPTPIATAAAPPPAAPALDLRGSITRDTTAVLTQKELAHEDKPGVKDDANFAQHWTVGYWRNWSWPPDGVSLTTASGLQLLAQEVAKRAAAANMARDATSVVYWAYHIARTAFFGVQGASAVLARSVSTGDLARGQASFLGGKAADAGPLFSRLALYLPAEAMGAYDADLRLVREGAFALPWDMTTPGSRQYNPLHVLRQGARYIREASAVLGKRSSEAAIGEIAAEERMPFRRSNLYPDYYQNDFHFQSDGWFSSASANIYDSATESLFLGRQDAMQRTALVPMSQAHPNTDGAGLTFLEVGAGTGRFATFVRDNFPAASVTVSDLSPYYLETARTAHREWQRLRGQGRPKTAFLQAAAEDLPVENGSVDVVYSVYMFHEMPTHARDAAIAEMARVLKPGGTAIITDSMQLGDRPGNDKGMQQFEKLNEPHYCSFIEYDFGAAFRAAGLQPGLKVMQSASKALSATKPLQV